MKYIDISLLGLILFSANVHGSPRLPGPVQQCADDAGPAYVDDNDTFGNKHYSHNSKAQPILKNNECASPLKEACQTKSPKVAYLDGPINCGGKGWFCRISQQSGWTEQGVMQSDANFRNCNTSQHDGHCHGGQQDDVYGWWTRDHWHRDYKGHLTCCCGLDLMPGVVDRCDFRKRINTTKELEKCRDANEEHTVDFEFGCDEKTKFVEPAVDPATKDQCWELTTFGMPLESSENDGHKTTSPSPSIDNEDEESENNQDQEKEDINESDENTGMQLHNSDQVDDNQDQEKKDINESDEDNGIRLHNNEQVDGDDNSHNDEDQGQEDKDVKNNQEQEKTQNKKQEDGKEVENEFEEDDESQKNESKELHEETEKELVEVEEQSDNQEKHEENEQEEEGREFDEKDNRDERRRTLIFRGRIVNY